MIASTQITNTEIFGLIAVLVFKLLSGKVLVINREGYRTVKKFATFLRKLETFSGVNYYKIIVGMRIFQDAFTSKRSFISAFSICMSVPLRGK